MTRIEALQGNVVDLTDWDLGEGGVHVATVVKWMGSNPAGLTKLKLDTPKACVEVVSALHKLVGMTSTLVDLEVQEVMELPEVGFEAARRGSLNRHKTTGRACSRPRGISTGIPSNLHGQRLARL
jgi:hypothetical protein